MAEFKYFKPLIVPLEGDKVTNDPDDAGGLTKFGISKRQYPHVDIANLTLGDASDIYERDFWNFYKLYNINSQPLANKIMSFLINMGAFSAVQCLQKALNVCGKDVLEDGILGSKTTFAINQSQANWVLDRYKLEAVMYYVFRAKVDKSQVKYLAGWINRAVS